MRKTPAQFEGKTARQIEAILIARRVDRIVNERLERHAAVQRANVLANALTTLTPRKLNF
ncbi:hypothetical protein GCM10010991_28520 [Gemmobacter aquaticus]|uniref:Uncharacterized protein n=1 Tax=Gemmobacter aquaticus TaxID=490185 RepID=A0A918DEK7_9RHOB|nr:hypothetical protein [Gemmobacter aquaticus]GGO35746.1 hypothetical protein GCM10010991_28520 [Gemmobacter aquaticus]